MSLFEQIISITYFQFQLRQFQVIKTFVFENELLLI